MESDNIYRLYLDESGHHRYVISPDLKERYLGLTGIIVRKDIYAKEVVPRIESIRSMFYSDPDYKPALHLEDIMSGKNDFFTLQSPDVQTEFNQQLLGLYANVDYQIITVVIDKAAHFTNYSSPAHPYSYVAVCMLERYCKFLKAADGRGDVIAEARGKKEDRTLQEVFNNFYSTGTDFWHPDVIQSRLSSKKLKLKEKSDLTAGVEMADLLALCSKLDVLHYHGKLQSLSNNFTKVVIETIQPKYFKGPAGVKGNGKKYL